jgi:glycine C-acetyltransferase
MSMERLNAALVDDLEALRAEGRAKAPERVITGYVAPEGARGPRYLLEGGDRPYIRMNSNSYLSLSHHPAMLRAADEAAAEFGVGPGAVRFIDGTFRHHVSLERRIADFMGKPSAKIFNSAYTSNLGLALSVQNAKTYWIGDALNHNCIIRAMRIANVPRENKAIYAHNDVEHLERCLAEVPEGIERVIVIFDGVFSMRGDVTPLKEIHSAVEPYRNRFAQGLITVVDDSHGIGAFGATGRGTVEHCGAPADVIVGTFGKAFGVNGGFVAGSPELIEAVRQKADTYIYTNPLSVADCAAAEVAIDLCDGDEGRKRLSHLHDRISQFREGIAALGLESIDGPHPVVPLLVRDTAKCQRMVRDFFERGVLVVGLAFPVVPEGDDTIRFQLNAAHTEQDVEEVLSILSEIR